VLRPLKVVITNYPRAGGRTRGGQQSGRSAAGTRVLPFSRELYIDQEDFREEPPKKFFRLSPGREVRLRYAYFITCQEVVKERRNVVELRCTYDPPRAAATPPDGRKVKATLHWSRPAGDPSRSAPLRALVQQPDPNDAPKVGLESEPQPQFLGGLKPCYVEPSLAGAAAGSFFQFERLGYFCVDRDSTENQLVFNRTLD